MTTPQPSPPEEPVSPLNPLTSRGALTLLYWVFFKPSALRRHVIALAPELAEQRGLLLAWRHPVLGLFLRRTFLFTLIASFAADILTGLLVAVRGGRYEWIGSLSIVALCVVGGVALSVVGSRNTGVRYGVSTGVSFGVSFSVSFGVLFGVAGAIGRGMAFGMSSGIMFGTVLGVASGMLSSIVFGAAVSVAFGVGRGIVSGAMTSVTVGVGWLFGALRIPFYLGEILWALWLWTAKDPVAVLQRAPALWDDLMILPQPGLGRLLVGAIRQEPAAGLRAATQVAANPFQRWAAGRALRQLWESEPDRLFPLLDGLLREPPPYIAVGSSRAEREREKDPYFAVKLLLGEVCGQSPISGFSDQFARLFTRPWRTRPDGSSKVCGLVEVYYRLLTGGKWRTRDLIASEVRWQSAEELHIPPTSASQPIRWQPADRRKWQPDYLMADLAAFEPFRDVAYGEETHRTFATLGHFLDYEQADDLRGAVEAVDWVADIESPLRPDVLTHLRRLAVVGRDVRAYRNLSGETDKRDALTRAALGIREVGQAAGELYPPESMLVAAVAKHWADLIATEQEALAHPRPVLRVVSRYIIGPPLRPEHGRLFVGRDEHFRQIESWWANPLNKPSVVVHGQRRMGKSSILYHLGQHLGSEYVTIYADLQREAAVESTGAFLYNLADVVYRSAKGARLSCPLLEPRLPDYAGEPFIPFNHFLDTVEVALGEDRWLALMLDEFEEVETKLKAGVFPPDLLRNFRNAMQHRPRLALVFAGCHTLDQMTREYWGPFFGAARNLKVDYLSRGAAEALITNPWDGFELNYEREAVARIIEVTCGQPYLLQTVCDAVIGHVNERLRQSGAQVLPTVSRAEVDAVLDSVLTAGYYFEAVWKELARHEQLALAALAESEPGAGEWVARPEVDARLRPYLSDDQIDEAWGLLAARDMVDADGRNRRFRVELVRRWTRKFQPLAEVAGRQNRVPSK